MPTNPDERFRYKDRTGRWLPIEGPRRLRRRKASAYMYALHRRRVAVRQEHHARNQDARWKNAQTKREAAYASAGGIV